MTGMDGIADAMLGVQLKGHLKTRTKFSALPGYFKSCKKKTNVIYIVYISKFFGGGGNAHSPNHSSH